MSSNIYTIYKATNIITGKCYIGFDSNWPKRKQAHLEISFKDLSKGYNSHFHCAIRKYGKKSFTWDILYQSKDRYHTLRIMEPAFILEHDSLRTGYNMTPGGDGWIGGKHTEETKKYFSILKKNYIPWNKGIHTNQGVKSYHLIDPNGNNFIVIGLSKFCSKNKLNPRNLYKVASDGFGSHRGWRCFSI